MSVCWSGVDFITGMIAYSEQQYTVSLDYHGFYEGFRSSRPVAYERGKGPRLPDVETPSIFSSDISQIPENADSHCLHLYLSVAASLETLATESIFQRERKLNTWHLASSLLDRSRSRAISPWRNVAL